jgi:hypothetical protein
MKTYGKGYCFIRNGWTYLHVEGDPYERGFQHGHLLAKEMGSAINVLKHFTFFTMGKEFQYFVDNADKMFRSFLKKAPEYEEEIKGIVDGAKNAGVFVSFEEVVGWNGYLELLYFWWPWKKKHNSAQRTDFDHCSAFIATGDATKNNTIVMAHNTWDYFVLAQGFNVIADIKPSNGFGMIMQTAPGYIASMTDFFVTGAGLVGTETTIQTNNFNENGKPEFLRAREAMQYAKTIKEWAKIMKQDNNGGYANSWLLGDINSNEIARFELGLEYDSLTKTSNGIFVGFNAPEDPRIRNLECDNHTYSDIRAADGARRLRWKQLTDQYYGIIDVENAQDMISDHFDVYLNKLNPCTRTICNHSDEDVGEFPCTSVPYSPKGARDGKVLDSELADKMEFLARWGRPCGTPFDTAKFFKSHPQWDWQTGYLANMPYQPWTLFSKEMINA